MEEELFSEEEAIAYHDSLGLLDSQEPPQRQHVQESLERLQACAFRGGHFSIPVQFRIAEALVFIGHNLNAIVVLKTLEDVCAEVGDSCFRALACIKQGLLLLEMGNRDESMCVLQRGMALAQKCSPQLRDDINGWLEEVRYGRYMLGRQLYDANDFQNALECLQGLDSPAQVHYFLASAQMMVAANLPGCQKEGFRNALKHCQIYRGLCREARTYDLMAQIYIGLENFEEAAEMFAESANLAQEEGNFQRASEMWFYRGHLLTGTLQRHKAAVTSFISSLDAALRVKDEGDQVSSVFNAKEWLERTLSVVRGASIDTWVPTSPGDMPSQPTFEFTRAVGLCALGIARSSCEIFNEARPCFEEAIHLIHAADPHAYSPDDNRALQNCLYKSQWNLAELCTLSSEWEKVLELFKGCKQIIQLEEERLRCDIKAGMALKRLLRYNEALDAFTQAMKDYCSLLAIKWDLNAQLLCERGQVFLALGNRVEAVSSLEEARKILEEKKAFDTEIIGLVYLVLFNVYMEYHEVWDGFQLAKSFQAVLNASVKERHYHGEVWKYMTGVVSSVVADHDHASKVLTEVWESRMEEDLHLNRLNENLHLNWLFNSAVLVNLANAYKRQLDFDSAFEKYTEAIKLVPENEVLNIAEIHINRASLYFFMVHQQANTGANKDKNRSNAYDDFDTAITSLESLLPRADDTNSLPKNQIRYFTNSLAKAYTGQAGILIERLKLDAASEKVRKAQEYAGNDIILVAQIKHMQAWLYAREGVLEKAQNEAREAALLFASLQMELQDWDSAWVSLLGGEMKHVFIFMQILCIDLKDHLQALLWAERGRMRLFFHSLGQPEEEHQDRLWFDNDDQLAKECLYHALNNCGLDTAIVEYTYGEAEGLLCIYLIQSQALELLVRVQKVHLAEFFAMESNSRSWKKLNSLISGARTEIRKREDDKAKQSLSILYRLLVEPIWQYIVSCSTVLFAPHERLSLVPFAALYDDQQRLFLIEQKAVGIIPSIRTLHHCFAQQSRFEDGMRAHKLAPAFVCGDPQPMGLGLNQLKGAAKEACAVAKLLGVEPVLGPKMTRQAVIDGLCNACVSVLVTHGIVDEASFPHGALVMQGQGNRVHQASVDTLARDLTVRGVQGHNIREAIKSMPRMSDVLTSDDIANLGGRVPAGLVVLSACQTGEGKVSSEGLLGLGRAMLQAGAPSVALMLWKVDDDSTRDLVTGLFKHLVQERRTIVESIQMTMLQMIRSGSCIYYWAPVLAFGSPTVRLVE